MLKLLKYFDETKVPVINDFSGIFLKRQCIISRTNKTDVLFINSLERIIDEHTTGFLDKHKILCEFQ